MAITVVLLLVAWFGASKTNSCPIAGLICRGVICVSGHLVGCWDHDFVGGLVGHLVQSVGRSVSG